MDNMGGLRKLYFIDSADFVSLEPFLQGLFWLVLIEGAEIIEIPFTDGTGKISEIKENSDNGTVYNFEVSCIIPMCNIANIDIFDGIDEKRLLILGEDNNGRFWLTGSPGSYFIITTNSSTGEAPANLNSRLLKISAALMSSSVFILSPALSGYQSV